jgi:hypothetical protein
MSKASEFLDLLLVLGESFEKLPKGWTEDSLDKFAKSLTDKSKDDPEGFFTECVKKMKETDIDDPEAFCGSLKSKYLSKK